MKLAFEQLANQLNQPLSAAYLISGDEPMQKLDAVDRILKSAREQGIHEREVFHVDAKFSWPVLLQQSGTMSLFAEKRILDIRLDKVPLKAGQEILQSLLGSGDQDLIVLITSPKLDARVQKQPWVKSCMNSGVWLPVWPIEQEKLPQWLIQRVAERKRRLTYDAALYLSHQVRGNLLAARQELDKACFMIAEGEEIDLAFVEQQVADNARYTVWELLENCLKGNHQLLPQILTRLKQEKTEPMLLARMLQKDCLQLEKFAGLISEGGSMQQVFSEYRIWPARQKILGPALKRYRVNGWQRLWVRALTLEKVVLGLESGNFWDDCLELLMLMAGKSLWVKQVRTVKQVNY